MKDLIIFGAGGLGREVQQIVCDLNSDKREWNLLGYLDGNRERHDEAVHELPILGDATWLERHPSVSVVVAIGNPAAKRRVVAALAPGRDTFATLIHPRAWVGSRVCLGQGSIVFGASSLTTDVTIGDHVTVNPGCSIAHDAVIEDFVTLAPGVNVSGTCRVREGSDLGTNCALIQGVTVGPWSIVGAGAVVVDDLPANVTAVGVPARPIKTRPEGWQLA